MTNTDEPFTGTSDPFSKSAFQTAASAATVSSQAPQQQQQSQPSAYSYGTNSSTAATAGSLANAPSNVDSSNGSSSALPYTAAQQLQPQQQQQPAYGRVTSAHSYNNSGGSAGAFNSSANGFNSNFASNFSSVTTPGFDSNTSSSGAQLQHGGMLHQQQQPLSQPQSQYNSATSLQLPLQQQHTVPTPVGGYNPFDVSPQGTYDAAHEQNPFA
jgi:hypothetical protein